MKKVLIIILILFVSVFTIIFVNGCYFVFWGQEKAMSKLQNNQDLNLYECCSIYTMHMAVWMFGWPLSPEAARECFKLHFSQQDTVEFKTTNAIYSPKIAKACESLSDKPVGTSIIVTWNGDIDYALKSPEHRAAIALNPCKITRVKTPEYFSMYGIYHCEVISPMIYPKYSETKFNLGKVTVTIHEGLFRYLQDKGWLSKYVAKYKFSEWPFLN